MISVNKIEDKNQGTIRFVCISDTHGKTSINVPNGDILIHSGDLTRRSSLLEYKETIEWLASLPHKIKIITAGNHDHYLDSKFGYIEEKQLVISLMQKNNLIYLEHEKYQLPQKLGGFKLFVSPYAPIHFKGAFMLKDLSHIWNDLDDSIDILVTHTPPFGYLDVVRYHQLNVGCRHLRDKVDKLQPKVHIFGHIHESYGSMFNEQGQLFINACVCNHRYKPNQKPITFDMPIEQLDLK